jgi:inner membrane protein
MTSPTFGNTILWRYMADVDSGFVAGYYSLNDRGKLETPRYIPKNDSLLDPVRESRAVQTLLWFSKGYYAVREVNGSLQFSDLRFGEFIVDLKEEPAYIFTWEIYDDAQGEVTFRQADIVNVNFSDALEILITRIGGRMH